MQKVIERREVFVMKKVLMCGVLMIAGMLLVFTGCSGPPTEEIEAAESALERAEEDPDVRRYAQESLVRARNLVDRMRAAAGDEEYDSARSLAEEAVAAAEKAIDDAAAAKEQAEDDASSAISAAKTLLGEVERSLLAARGVRGILLDVSATQEDVDEAEQTISAAENDFADAAYAEALSKAREARAALADIQSKIADLVQAATRRK